MKIQKKEKVYSSFRDNIWGVDLADMQSLSKCNKGIKYLLCAIDLFSKYAWVVPLKDKRGIRIVNTFQKIISKGRKPNKTWVDQGGQCYNNLFKKLLKMKEIEMYSSYKEGKSVVPERFIRTLKNKIFKHMTAISKSVYFNVLDDIVNKYNQRGYRAIKMKPIKVTFDSYAEYNEDSKEKVSKLKIGDQIRISKYKNIFAKGCTQNWCEEVFIISKTKHTVPWTYAISDWNGEPIAGSSSEKELQKNSQEKFRTEKVIKRKGHKFYVKWKGYDNSFNSWVKKRPCIKTSQYFPKSFRSFAGNINVTVDLSNYATKADLKNITHTDTSNVALKTN